MFRKHLLASTAAFSPPREGTDGPDDLELEGDTEHGEVEDGDALEAAEEAGDAGAEDGEGQEEGEEGQVGDEPPARRPSRAQTRIQTLQTATKEAREKADRLEREIQELRAESRQRAQQAQQETPEARASRRALMAPEEVMREDLRESEGRMTRMLQQQVMETRERDDRRAYDDALRETPKLAKYKDEVERIRKEQESNGQFVPREVILDLVVGRAARAAARSGTPTKQAAAAQRRVAGATTQPPGGKGNVAAPRGRQGDSLEKRLENVQI